MSKVTTLEQAMNLIQDGMSVMVGGFMAVGTPELFMDALVEKGTRNLTIICNDAGLPEKGVGKLIARRQVKRLIASHIGLNPEAGKLMNTDEMAVDLVPQGTLAERIRCGGAGIGGFLRRLVSRFELAIDPQEIAVRRYPVGLQIFWSP